MLREFLIVASAHLLAVMSPGPDLGVVMKLTLRRGRSEGQKAAFGIALANMFHIALSLIGLAALLKVNKDLFRIIQLVGSLYLLWIAYHALKSSISLKKAGSKSIETKVNLKEKNSLLLGLLTSLTNPKVTLFYLTLFTQVVSNKTPMFIKSLYGLEMILATLAWFTLVSYALNIHKVRELLQSKMWIIELLFGIIVGLIGIIVLTEAI